MEHQDLRVINIGNKNLKKSLGQKNMIPKGNNLDLHKLKIENEQENFTIKKIPKDLSIEIANARNSKKITQKDMALRLNIQKDIINNIESGKANYDPQTKQVVNKIQNFLGIKFKNKNKNNNSNK